MLVPEADNAHDRNAILIYREGDLRAVVVPALISRVAVAIPERKKLIRT